MSEPVVPQRSGAPGGGRRRLLLWPAIVDRYLVREIASPFAIALVLFTFFCLIPHLAEISDLLVGKSATWPVIGRLVWNILPAYLALTIPMAFLLAVLLAFGRLASESELIALRAVGISPGFLLRATSLLALLATGASYYVHAEWVPDANQRYRETAFSLAISRAQGAKPRVFLDDMLPNRSVWIKDVDPRTGAWKDAFILDRADPMKPRIWLTRSGALKVNRQEKRVEMEMEQGAMYSFDTRERKAFEVQRFSKGRFPIAFTQLFPDLPLSRGDREMTPSMLLSEIARYERDGNFAEAARYAVEYHKKYALSVVPIIFGIVGLGLMLGGRRDSRGSAFGLAIGIIFFYYVLSRLGEQAGDTRALPPALAVWLPNVVLLALAVWLFARARREGTSAPFRAMALVGFLQSRFSKKRSTLVAESSQTWLDSLIGVLDRYISREFLKLLSLAVVALLTLPILLEFMDLLDDVQQNRVKGMTLARYFFFNTPFYLFSMVLPMAVLVATLATFGLLARRNEMTAIKATGISVYRAAAPALCLASLIGVLMFWGSDSLVPQSKRLATREHDIIKGRPPRSNTARDRHMALGSDGRFYSYDSLTPASTPGSVVFRGLTVLDVDQKNWSLREHLLVDDVRWDGRVYEMSHGFRRSFSKDGAVDRVIENVKTGEIDPPAHFEQEDLGIDELSYTELDEQIGKVESVGLDGTTLRVGLHRKISYPTMCLVMAFVGLPFSFSVGKRGALFGVGVALVLAGVYQISFEFFKALGAHAVLPALLAAWAPNLIFIAIGAFLFFSIET